MNHIQEPAHFAVWPQRVPREIPPVATTLWHNLDVSARRYPDKAALVFFGQPVSYRQLEGDALRIAGWLEREAKVAHGDRVLLMMQNSPQFVIAAYAILRAGAVLVPVNPMSRADELAHYIEDPQARVAIVAADLLTHMEQGNAQLAPEHRLSAMLVGCYADYMPAEPPDAELGPPAWQEWLHARPSLPPLATDWQQALRCDPPVSPPPQDPDALMALCYTSGTTGKPKGCMHTHRTIGHNTVPLAPTVVKPA